MKNSGQIIAAIGLVVALLSAAPFLLTVALSQEPAYPAAEGALMALGGACGMAVMVLGLGLFSASVLFQRSLRPVLLPRLPPQNRAGNVHRARLPG